jgi:hypothetical protein
VIAANFGQERHPNLWKPLIDSLGPILGEHPSRGPHDDRIVDLGLHHHVEPDLGHGVTIHLWSTTVWREA